MCWQGIVVSDPNILMGKPVIKGTRISVAFIVELLSEGWSHQQFFDNYPQITEKDLRAALSYCAARIKNEEIFPLQFGT